MGDYVIKFHTDSIQNNGEFFTDSNSLSYVKRRYNPSRKGSRDPWQTYNNNAPGNYYPVTHAIFIEDEVSDQWMVVMNEHSQGGSSLSEGTVELMFDRRMPDNDDLGVYEPLDDKNNGLAIRSRHKYLIAFPRSREETFDLVIRN